MNIVPKHGVYDILIGHRIELNVIFAKNRSFLGLWKMPNVKSKKLKTSAASVPTVTIQVLGSGAVGVPSNAIIISGHTRYLINCGEGTQKLGNEYRFGLEKLSHVFITSPTWKNVSGLLGLALSHLKSNRQELTIHGHNYIENIFSGVNKFVHLRYNLPKFKRCNHYEEFSDGNISVKYIYLYSSSGVSKNSPEKSLFETPDKGESSGLEKELPVVDDDVFCSPSEKHGNDEKINKKNASNRDSGSQNKNKYVISYIFQTPSTPGTLLSKKCFELGVPPGPLLGELKNGKDVVLSNGTLIRSADVKEPDLPGVNIIVVDCPSEDYLDSLLEEPIYSSYQSKQYFATAVIHFSSVQVLRTPKYQEWIKSFSNETRHLFINENNKLTGSVSIRRLQFKLNYLQPNIFPLLQDAEIPDFPRAENCSTENEHTLFSSSNVVEPIYSDQVFYKCKNNFLINGETFCTLYLKPKTDYDYMKCLVLKKQMFLNEMFKDDTQRQIDIYKKKIKDLELSLNSETRIYPKIVFLGTGSGKPSKVRNASGILIFLEEDKCIMFDCGENTYNQLINFYGKEKVEEILRKLIAIYVSHLHVDHHLGLITLLKERKLALYKQNELLLNESKVQKKEKFTDPEFQPVILMAPLQIRRWLSLYCEKFEDISDLLDLLPNDFLDKNSNELPEKKENCKKRLNLNSVMTVRVNHCNGSFGISIVHKNGWKITYSGDTRPCDELVTLGMESDILIHEATFEDAYFFEAKMKNHSTTSQAIDVGRRMNAKYILLTHFSQRYCYLPVIEDDYKNLNIGFAFDFMEVPFNKLQILPALFEPLQYIFSEYDSRIKTNNLQMYLDLKRKQNEEDISSEDTGRPAKTVKKTLESDKI